MSIAKDIFANKNSSEIIRDFGAIITRKYGLQRECVSLALLQTKDTFRLQLIRRWKYVFEFTKTSFFFEDDIVLLDVGKSYADFFHHFRDFG